jgi:hypothetical protein
LAYKLLTIRTKRGDPFRINLWDEESEVMTKGIDTAEIISNDCGLDKELLDRARQERTLILKADPASRKVQFMAHGVKEIRCSRCSQIRPIASAEQSEEGWICEDCLPR